MWRLQELHIFLRGGGVLQICHEQVDNDHEIVDLDNMTTELPASF